MIEVLEDERDRLALALSQGAKGAADELRHVDEALAQARLHAEREATADGHGSTVLEWGGQPRHLVAEGFGCGRGRGGPSGNQESGVSPAATSLCLSSTARRWLSSPAGPALRQVSSAKVSSLP